MRNENKKEHGWVLIGVNNLQKNESDECRGIQVHIAHGIFGLLRWNAPDRWAWWCCAEVNSQKKLQEYNEMKRTMNVE